MLLFTRWFSKNHKTRLQGTGFFQGASNFTIHKPQMVDRSTIIQNFNEGRPVLSTLFQEMTPGADVDSSARHPPPLCHPGTREWLTKKIKDWLYDEQRKWDLLWLYGPAGVGKSAVAQTLAEYCLENGRLGAAFFFSRTNDRSDYARLWITIAYQLAVRVPEYQVAVAKQIAADPALLKKAPPVQFKRLIVEPLSRISPRSKILIILDGLDECETEDAQLNIIQLISDLVRSTPEFPVVWMICSRPEYHLKQSFSDNDFVIDCWRKEIPIDSQESKRDVELFLRDGFKEIRRRYSDFLDESWPPESELSDVIDTASGLFAFASTVVRYVGDRQYGNPPARLKTVIRLPYSRSPSDAAPLKALDLLYSQILSEVPADILPITLHILHSTELFGNSQPAIVIANACGISRTEFHQSLMKLHSVLDVPSPKDGVSHPVKVIHKSFQDFLENPHRSHHFHWTRHVTALAQIKTLFPLASSITFPPSGNDIGGTELSFTWTTDNAEALLSLKRAILITLGESLLWPSYLDSYDEYAFELIRTFNYNILAKIQALDLDMNDSYSFQETNARFFESLSKEPHTQYLADFIRTEPTSESDVNILRLFMIKVPDAIPLRVECNPNGNMKILLISIQSAEERLEDLLEEMDDENVWHVPFEDPKTPQYFFFGYGSGTVPAIFREHLRVAFLTSDVSSLV